MTRLAALGFSLIALGFFLYLISVLFLQALPTSDQWFSLLQPGYWDYRTQLYSALAMLFGTVVVAAIALLLAVPIGLGAAIFVSEFLRDGWRVGAKVGVELLAGIPSVVYGLLGVFYLSRWMEAPLMHWGGSSGSALCTGGVLLAVMILPTVMTFSEDALRCVPRQQRESSWGLGLSKAQTVWHVVLPQAWRGILGAVLLALGRAIGETVAVYLVVGRSDQLMSWKHFSLDSVFKAGQTVTSKLGGSEVPIAFGDIQHWGMLMALGLLLWFFVGSIHFVSERFIGKT